MIPPLIGGLVFKKIFQAIVTKKRMIGWASALVLAAGAAATSMETKEFKEAVCGAAVIEAEPVK